MQHLKRIYPLLLFCLLVVSKRGKAQLVPIQDSSFAAFLCQIRPTLTSDDCKMLDTTAAANSNMDLYLNNRGIKKADEIIYFKNTHVINAQKNALVSIPNLSGLRNDLEILDLSFNNLTRLQGLERLWDLKALNVSNNQLKSFPDLSSLDLKQVNLMYNQLSFKDFIPLSRATNFANVYSLMPQNNLTPDTTIHVVESASFTLHVPIDEGVPNVYYSWKKNGQPLPNEYRSSLRFSKLTQRDSGVYMLFVTSSNPKLAYVGVNSGAVRIRIKPCQQMLQFELVPKIECEESSVTLSSLSLSNDDASFESFLENSLTGFKTKIQRQQAVPVEEGYYHFVVTDGKNCTVKKGNALRINAPASCSAIFTPNGDGYQDELFLDGSGEVHILNKEGRDIKTLHLPCYWSGVDDNGNNVPLGTYLLLRKDGTREKITVLR